MKRIATLIFVIFTTGKLFSQDTLPNFTLSQSGNRAIISWTNPFPNVVQLNVQRSYDSLRFFSTIFAAPTPSLPQNGYSDNIPGGKVYYRIFYVLEGGSYFFTKSKRTDGTVVQNSSASSVASSNTSRDVNLPDLKKVIPGDKRVVTIKIKDSIYKQLSINAFRNFRDSILYQTKDTLFAFNDSVVGIHPYLGSQVFSSSQYVYVNRNGYINISVPAAPQKKYSLKFFEENGSGLFEIANIKESPLILDKSNFVHAGWFLFELYEDNKLKEKSRFYLPKDF